MENINILVKCKECKEEKNINEFYKGRRKCKECKRNDYASYYNKNIDRFRKGGDFYTYVSKRVINILSINNN